MKQQLFSESEFSFKYIPKIKSELNLVSSPTEKFYNADNQLVLLSGNFHPFVELALEGLKDEYSFKHIKGGIAWDTKNRKIKCLPETWKYQHTESFQVHRREFSTVDL